MKNFQTSKLSPNHATGKTQGTNKKIPGKAVFNGLFLVSIILVFISNPLWYGFKGNSHLDVEMMALQYKLLKESLIQEYGDTTFVLKERKNIVEAIESKLAEHLNNIRDYSPIEKLEPYLRLNPYILNEVPSSVPLENGDFDITSQYGFRLHPITKNSRKHFGFDFSAPKGTEIFATAAGVVSKIEYAPNGYGKHIVIDHRFGFSTLYGHINKVLVREGQKVKQHEFIATVGKTGSSTGYHLHYEVIKNNIKIDPVYSFDLKRRIFNSLMK